MSYRTKAGQPEAANGADPETELLPCRWCGNATQRKHLVQYGARCWDCYRDYAGRNAQEGPYSAQEKAQIIKAMGGIGSAHPMAWAHLLRAQEKAGQPVGAFARRAWREALRELPGAAA